jgi:phosphohistidine phosphatase SixA
LLSSVPATTYLEKTMSRDLLKYLKSCKENVATIHELGHEPSFSDPKSSMTVDNLTSARNSLLDEHRKRSE